MIKIETPKVPNQNQIGVENKKEGENKNKSEIKKENNENSKVDESPKKEIPKGIKLFKNLLSTPKNVSTLEEIYASLETEKAFEMSKIKNPPNFSDERIILANQGINKKVKHVNYPLSAIGLLECDYGNGLIVYGTGTLIGLNYVLTCAHILYSPVLKRRCNRAIFYMNLSNGKYLDESEVETFAIPVEYESNIIEKYDYGLCVLKEDLAKKGGYLGICCYEDKEDISGYLFGYSNIKSTRNFVSSFKTNRDEYEIMGVKTSLRYIEEDKSLIYIGNRTKEGQDGSPVFKVIDDLEEEYKRIKDKKEKEKMEKEKKEKKENKDKKVKKDKKEEKKDEVEILKFNILNSFGKQKYDVKIFAIDCSMTSMILRNVNTVMLDNKENINLDEMTYIRHHKALIIDDDIINRILRWMYFYETIMPRGKIDPHIKEVKSIYNNLLKHFDFFPGTIEENKMLAINCCDLRGKDVLMLLNSQFDISQITVLDLSNNSINHEGVQLLVFQEGLCFNLIELNLAENMLNSKAAKYLTEIEFNFLDKLNISKNNIGPLGAKTLAEKGKFPNLRELDISDNYLSKEGARGLSNGDAFKHVISLHIEDNEINDYGLYLLAKGKLNGVSELFIGRNKLGDDGLAYLDLFENLEILDLEGNLLTYKGVSNIIGKNFANIKRINLDNNYIGVEGTYIIASQMKKIRKNDKDEYSHIDLRSLSLVRNNICTKGAELISIMNLELIEELNISENFINDLGFYFLCKGKLKNLKKLDASLNRISDKGLVYITEANFLEGLTFLNLAGNDFTDDGVKYITFCKMSNLGHLDLTLNYLKSKTGSHLSKSFFNLLSSLSLERNKIKSHGLKNLVKAKFFINLVKLNLAYCKLGNEGCQILRDVNVSSIEVLNLKENFINDDGVILLCQANFDNLKDLNLEDNDIGKEGVNAICEKILKKLAFLRMKGNPRLGQDEINKILNSCDSRFEKEHNYTFRNFSQISYGTIRYCLRHPEILKNIFD